MAGISPTQNSLKAMRSRGYLSAVVEHWNPFAKIRQDLYGIIDVLGVKEGSTLAVQSTSYTNVSARIKKVILSAATPTLLAAGWKFEIHGWHKKNNKWTCRVVEITKDDLI